MILGGLNLWFEERGEIESVRAIRIISPVVSCSDRVATPTNILLLVVAMIGAGMIFGW